MTTTLIPYPVAIEVIRTLKVDPAIVKMHLAFGTKEGKTCRDCGNFVLLNRFDDRRYCGYSWTRTNHPPETVACGRYGERT